MSKNIKILVVIIVITAMLIILSAVFLKQDEQLPVESTSSVGSNGTSSVTSTASTVSEQPDPVSEGGESSKIKTIDIFNLAKDSNMAVTLYYDVEEPTVSFIDPDGAFISVSDLSAERGTKAVCYYIPNAKSGQWQMNCDKKRNIDCSVNWAPY